MQFKWFYSKCNGVVENAKEWLGDAFKLVVAQLDCLKLKLHVPGCTISQVAKLCAGRLCNQAYGCITGFVQW